MAEISIVPFNEICQSQRWDGEFFSPKAKALIASLTKSNAQPLATFIKSAHRGLAPEYNTNGKVPVIRTVNVRDLEFSDARQEFVSHEFLGKTTRGIIEKFDIVATSTGVGTLGRVFCNIYDNIYFADGHITVLKPKANVDYAYLTAVLQSEVGLTQFERWQRGSSGQIEIYPEDILQILIPKLSENLQDTISLLWKESVKLVQQAKSFYPEAEQELLERLDWNNLQKQQTELCYVENTAEFDRIGRMDAEHFQPKFKRLREHLLKYNAARLGAVCKSVAKGTQPNGYIDNGEVTVVKSKNVFGQGIDFDNCECTTIDAYADIPARLINGDLVINATGFGTLGRAAFIPSRKEKIVASVDLVILRLQQTVLPEYAALFLNSPAGMMQSEMFQTGSSGQLHLYPQHIQEFLIYLPRNQDGSVDLTWQRKLADKVVGASRAKQEAQEKLAQAKKLVENAINNV